VLWRCYRWRSCPSGLLVCYSSRTAGCLLHSVVPTWVPKYNELRRRPAKSSEILDQAGATCPSIDLLRTAVREVSDCPCMDLESIDRSAPNPPPSVRVLIGSASQTLLARGGAAGRTAGR